MKKILVNDVQSLVDCIAQELQLSKRDAKKLIDSRSVFVNGARVWIGKHQLMIGDSVEIVGALINKKNTERHLEIIFDSGDALVINKSAGIECVNGHNHIEAQLRTKWPHARVVHRLDRDTSGCLLATSSEAAWDFFIDQFKSNSIMKRYVAIFTGQPRRSKISVDSPLDGKSAKTIFIPTSTAGDFTFCEIELLTGRTHQIRRHAKELGWALLGDRQYGPQSMIKSLRSVPRQMLHAWKLGFTPSHDKNRVEVTAEMPNDFLSWKNKLRL